jgi:hypothetical protein
VIFFYNLFLFETTCAISAYHHWSCEFQSRSWRGVLDTKLCDKVCRWLAKGRLCTLGTPFPQTNQTNPHDIAEILFESGVKHHNHRKKISEYFLWNIIIPLCHLFTYGNKICDNPAAAPLPPFTYMPLRWGVVGTTLCDKVCRWLAVTCGRFVVFFGYSGFLQ